MSLHVIAGAGAVGTTTALLLAERGHDVRLLSRRGTGPDHPRIERRSLDVTDAAALAAVTTGAAALYNAVNPPYTRWPTDWPPIADAVLHAAERTGAVLVTMSNLYGYGPVSGPITEDLPLAATGAKGKVRADLWRQALAAHTAGRVRATEVRASDFFGPRVGEAMLGERVMTRLLAGKSAPLLGDPDTRHSVSFLPDVAELLVAVATDERAWGQAWHVPSAPALTQRETVAVLAAAAGRPGAKVSVPPRFVLRLAGLVVPIVRELRETSHQFEHDWVLDSSRAERTFGLRATPLADAATATVAWYRHGPAREAVPA
jgi:nucleoside-diphosphate-sugar epimerase